MRRFPGGEKATLLWDGLPAHRRRAMRAWLSPGWWSSACPPRPPELNPTEGLWSSLKAVELANLCGPSLAEVIAPQPDTQDPLDAEGPLHGSPAARTDDAINGQALGSLKVARGRLGLWTKDLINSIITTQCQTKPPLLQR